MGYVKAWLDRWLQDSNVRWSHEYAEPGYSAEVGILFGNWNEERKVKPGWRDNPCVFPEGPDGAKGDHCTTHDSPRSSWYPCYACEASIYVDKTMARIAEVAEHVGYDVEWADEWANCDGCSRAVRTSPSSYSWEAHFRIVNECELLCMDCLLEDPEEYLTSLEGNHRTYAPSDLDLSSFGYRQFTGEEGRSWPFETGWHPGQDDDPKKVLEDLESAGASRIIFQLAENSQFYVRWKVYIHEEDPFWDRCKTCGNMPLAIPEEGISCLTCHQNALRADA